MLQKILKKLATPISILVLLVIICGFLPALIVREFSLDALVNAIKKLLGVVQEAMFDQDSSILLLFCYWLTLVAITVVFAFWLGRKSKGWEGWDYILYGRPISDNAIDDWMTFSEVRDYAKSKGWMPDGNEGNEAVDLERGIGDALSKGLIDVKGRFNPDHDTDLNRIYLIDIKQDHWIDCFINVYNVFIGWADHTKAATEKKVKGHPQQYVDLRLNRWQFKKWFSNDAVRWRGQFAFEREEQRKASKEFEAMFNSQDEVRVYRSPSDIEAVMKKRLLDEGANETVTNCNQFKLPAADGKMRNTDCADVEEDAAKREHAEPTP